MKRLIILLVCLLGITGCSSVSGYIDNGRYTNGLSYYKISGEDIEFIDEENLIEAYGTYVEKDGVITVTYTFRNDIDMNSSEYGNVVPYKRVDTLHLEDDKLILDKTTIEDVEEVVNKTFNKN